MLTIDEEIEEYEYDYEPEVEEEERKGSKRELSSEEAEKKWDKRIGIGFAVVVVITVLWGVFYIGFSDKFLISQDELRKEGERFYKVLVSKNAIQSQEIVWEGDYLLPRKPASEEFMNWIKTSARARYSKAAEDVYFRAGKRSVSEFVMVDQPRKCIFLETGYGKHKFMYDIGYLQPSQVVKISLIYSPFPKGIDMVAFNKQRISELLNRFPSLAAENIEWEVVEQVSPTNENEAKGLLHGFLVEYVEEAQ